MIPRPKSGAPARSRCCSCWTTTWPSASSSSATDTRSPTSPCTGTRTAREEAGLELEPYASFRAWLTRVESQPGYMEDVEPYGANAAPGAGQSIYG